MKVCGTSNLTDDVGRLPHRAARLLDHLRLRGASVTLATALWTLAQKQRAITWGPHKSSRGEREFVHNEIHDFCTQGYWIVLPFSVVQHWPSLRISPLGVVPQRNRRPRLIVDYTFSALNQETVKLPPTKQCNSDGHFSAFSPR